MKKFLCLFFALLSFLYYLWLGIHNSFHMSVLPFWLLLSMLLLAAAFLFPKLPAILRRLFRLCLIIGMLFFLLVEGCIVWGMTGNYPENLDYIIVLGAGLNGEKPSSVLEKRLESALAYLQTNPQTKAVVSGGQGVNESISEAESMKNWLLERGIDRSRILVENRSTSNSSDTFTVTGIRPFQIASRWGGYFQPPLFHTSCAVNAQACLNCYFHYYCGKYTVQLFLYCTGKAKL